MLWQTSLAMLAASAVVVVVDAVVDDAVVVADAAAVDAAADDAAVDDAVVDAVVDAVDVVFCVAETAVDAATPGVDGHSKTVVDGWPQPVPLITQQQNNHNKITIPHNQKIYVV